MELASEAAAALGPVVATPAGFSATLRVPADARVLAGHFPGHPVVPAVYLIEAAVTGARRAHSTGGLRGIRQAKFLREVPPGVEVSLNATLEAAPEGWILEAELTLAGERAALLCLELGPEDPR